MWTGTHDRPNASIGLVAPPVPANRMSEAGTERVVSRQQTILARSRHQGDDDVCTCARLSRAARSAAKYARARGPACSHGPKRTHNPPTHDTDPPQGRPEDSTARPGSPLGVSRKPPPTAAARAPPARPRDMESQHVSAITSLGYPVGDCAVGLQVPPNGVACAAAGPQAAPWGCGRQGVTTDSRDGKR